MLAWMKKWIRNRRIAIYEWITNRPNAVRNWLADYFNDTRYLKKDELLKYLPPLEINVVFDSRCRKTYDGWA